MSNIGSEKKVGVSEGKKMQTHSTVRLKRLDVSTNFICMSIYF